MGQPRTSTVALTTLFVAVLALWILVRPVPDSAGTTGASDQIRPHPAPSHPGASAPAYPTPTVTPSRSKSPRPHHSPTPTGSPTASPHPSRSQLGQSPSPTPTGPLQSVPATGSPSGSAPVGGTAPAAISSPTP
jgi:hypothetical protein